VSDELRRFALALLDETDATVLRHLRGGLEVRTKADATFVTQVDTEVEALIRDRIRATYPGHGILGEEFGSDAGEGQTRWIVDPIDGTNNLVRGIPVFGTLLAVEDGGELIAAAISAPALSRRWHAARGEGAAVRDLLGERPIHVSSVDRLGDAQLLTSGLAAMEAAGFTTAMAKLRTTVWRDRGFGDFWAYMLLAEGAADVMLEIGVSAWDLAAPAMIVGEAGGRLTDFAGQPSYAGPQSLATNGALHDAVLAVLEGS
jgi:histidinol-phosphatase